MRSSLVVGLLNLLSNDHFLNKMNKLMIMDTNNYEVSVTSHNDLHIIFKFA